MNARLLVQALDGLASVSVRRPRVRSAARDLAPAQVLRRDAAVPRGAVQLEGRVIERPRGRLEIPGALVHAPGRLPRRH